MQLENIFYPLDLFREVSSLELELEENKENTTPISCSSGSRGGLVALAVGSCLTLLSVDPSPDSTAEPAVLAELEFERPLEALCWAPGHAVAAGTGLVIAGDDHGTLHFVTGAGLLVYSKRVVQGDAAGSVFHSLQFDGGTTLLAFLGSGRVLSLMGLPIGLLAGTTEESDPAELAAHARNVQIAQGALPFSNPRSVAVVADGSQVLGESALKLKVFAIGATGGAYLVELGAKATCAEKWAFHKPGPGGSPASSILEGTECVSAVVLSDCVMQGSPLVAVILVLAADGRLLVIDTANEASDALLAALPPSGKAGKLQSIVSVLSMATPGDGAKLVFTVAIAGEAGVVQDVLMLFHVSTSTVDPSVSCALLPLSLTFPTTEKGARLLPVGAPSTSSCGGLLIGVFEQCADVRIMAHSGYVDTLVAALVAGIFDSNTDPAVPSHIENTQMHVTYVMGMVLSRSHFISQHIPLPRRSAEFSLYLMTMITGLPSTTAGGDISALVRCVMAYTPRPRVGFMEGVLSAAEQILARADYSDEKSSLQSEMAVIRQYHSFLETARSHVTSWIPQQCADVEMDGAPAQEVDEERVRAVVSELAFSLVVEPGTSLSDQLLYGPWRRCAMAGHLDESNALIERHYAGRWPVLSDDSLPALLNDMSVVAQGSSPYLSIAAGELATWVQNGLVPNLQAHGNHLGIEQCCEYLCAQALSLEFAFGVPFDSAALTNASVAVAEKYCPIIMDRKPCVKRFNVHGQNDPENKQALSISLSGLQEALALQAAVWRSWDDRPALRDVLALKLDGLVRNRLLDLAMDSEEADDNGGSTEEEYTTFVVDDINNVIRPLVSHFGGSLDAIMLAWVSTILGSALIAYSSTQLAEISAKDESSLVIMYARLVSLTSAIEDPNILAAAVLTLWQMSTSSSTSSLSLEDDPGAEEAQARALDRLAGIGSAVYPRVTAGRTKDALQESTRLLRLKSLAASYGIANFDVRNTRQLRGAVNIIATSYWRPKSIPDCIEFAEAWNSISVDLAYILGRALAARAMVREHDPKVSGVPTDEQPPMEALEKRKLLEEAYVLIPEHRRALTVETALSYLVDRLEDICCLLSAEDTAAEDLGALREEAGMACGGAVTLGHLHLDSDSAWRRGGFIDAPLLADLKRMRFLQSDYGIYLSVSGMGDPEVCRGVAHRLAKDRAKDLISISSTGSKPESRNLGSKQAIGPAEELQSSCPMLAAKTRHACLLMNVSPVFVEYNVISALIKEGEMEMAMEVAKVLSFESAMEARASLEGEGATEGVANSDLVLSAAVALCSLVARQASVKGSKPGQGVPVVETFALTRSILQTSTVTCAPEHLGRTLDLFGGCDFVVSVCDRCEGSSRGVKGHSAGAVNHDTKGSSGGSTIGSFQVSEHISFSRDGLLMSSETALPLLLRHVLKEAQRRGVVLGDGKRSLSGPSGCEAESCPDLTDFVAVLQRSENHILAVRALMSSWCKYDSKSKTLQSSLLALSRKILAYRDIDSGLGVACLAAVAYDTMVRELKQAVPSIQSDFSRLQTVAVIGEDLSRLWGQEELLGVFQSLQTNAKWWHTLGSHGIKIDPRAFQSSVAAQREACIRAVVPELLSKSNLNLELSIEYCCQFDVEGSYATLCYIEQLLLAPPLAPSDMHWMKLVRQAGATVGESSLVSLYSKLLRKINPLDYERIRFVSLWLLQTLSEDPSQDSPREDGPTKSIMQSCNRYADTISFLMGVSFSLAGVELVPAYEHVYAGLGASSPYAHRLPIWPLIDDTWGVLGPLLASIPEMGPKITLLCAPLGMDTDVFHSKRIMASSGRFPEHQVDVVSTNSETASREKAQVMERLAEFKDNVQCIEDPSIRTEVWMWAYRRESEARNWYVAETLLGAALEDTAQWNASGAGPSQSDPSLAKVGAIRGQLTLDLVKLQCRRALRELVGAEETKCPAESALSGIVENLSLANGENVDVILKRFFERAVEIAWELQLANMSAAANTAVLLCSLDLKMTRHFPQVSSFLHRIDATAKIIVSCCSVLDQHITGHHEPTASAGEKDQPSPVETIRHFFITKLLADGLGAHPLVEKNSPSATADPAGSIDKTPAHSTAGGWAGVLGIGESLITPTSADSRRRGDLFCAFSISALVGCCGSMKQRDAYFDQLQALAKSGGKAGKARRFTSRSKLRAAQALRYFPVAAGDIKTVHASKSVPSYPWSSVDDELWRLLYCTSELQELRLPCTEESLAKALGVSTADQPYDEPMESHDPRLLIRTLLRDEGHQSDVSELCRDILLCAGASKAGKEMWEELLLHMESHSHHRALLDTLITLRHFSGAGTCLASFGGSRALSLSSVCGGELGSGVVRVLNIFTQECSDKTQQFISLMQSRVCQEGDPPAEVGVHRNYSRVVLRLAARGCGWGLSDWDEAPEDLMLCIDQLSMLWTTFSSFCPPAALSQLVIPGAYAGHASCLQHSLAGCYRSLLEVGFNWLDWVESSSNTNDPHSPLAQLLESNLCTAMGFANATVYSRMAETCNRWTTTCLPSVVKVSVALQSNDGVTGRRHEDSSHVLRFAFDTVKELADRRPVVARPMAAASSTRYDIFDWLGVEDRSHWPWLILNAGFTHLPPTDVFSFLDERCIPSDSDMLTALLCAAANSWWRSTTPHRHGTAASRPQAATPAAKTPLSLVQWCLSSRERQILLSSSFSGIDATAKYRLLLAVEASQARLLQSKFVDGAVLRKILVMLKGST